MKEEMDRLDVSGGDKVHRMLLFAGFLMGMATMSVIAIWA